jgi:hypothetical protein
MFASIIIQHMKTKTVNKKNEIQKTKPGPLAATPEAKPTLSVGVANRKLPSEKTLAEFHKIILAKLNEAKKDHKILRNAHCYSDNNGTVILHLPR